MQAAYVALSKIYPAQQLTFDAHRTASLADISGHENAAAVAAGLAWGESVANQIWAWRLTDGIATPPSPWLGNTVPGQWRQTPNDPLPGTSTPGAGYPQFVGMTKWVGPPRVVAPPPPHVAPPPRPARARAHSRRDGRRDGRRRDRLLGHEVHVQLLASDQWHSAGG
jgi:hypothetical protein